MNNHPGENRIGQDVVSVPFLPIHLSVQFTKTASDRQVIYFTLLLQASVGLDNLKAS